jgi:signal transduction histidine kinase
MTSTVRQSLAYAGGMLAILMLLAGWIWSLTGGRADAQLTQLISGESYAAFVGVRDGGRDKAVAEIRDYYGHRPIRDRVILLADEQFRPLAGNLEHWPAAVGDTPGWHTLRIMREPGPSEARVLHRVLSDGSHLLYGYDLSDYFAGRRSFVVAFLGVSVLVGGSILLSGLYIRQFLLGQVAAINRATQGIMRGNLTRRVPESGRNRELNLLSRTINQMLEHTEQLVSGIAGVSNSVAHDLRTPLAEARARLERLLSAWDGQDVDTARGQVEAAMADIDRLIRVFNALQRLAQIEAGARRSGIRETDLVPVVAEVVEFYQHAAERKGQQLTLRGPEALAVACDPSLLAQALGNLLDNACKYTPAGGHIAVAVTCGPAAAAEIAVADDGPGIAEAERPKAVTRFYRGDTSRSTEGAGLGLSLVSAIAALHGGELRLEDNRPGLRATLVLPRDTDAPPAAGRAEAALLAVPA